MKWLTQLLNSLQWNGFVIEMNETNVLRRLRAVRRQPDLPWCLWFHPGWSLPSHRGSRWLSCHRTAWSDRYASAPATGTEIRSDPDRVRCSWQRVRASYSSSTRINIADKADDVYICPWSVAAAAAAGINAAGINAAWKNSPGASLQTKNISTKIYSTIFYHNVVTHFNILRVTRAHTPTRNSTQFLTSMQIGIRFDRWYSNLWKYFPISLN